MNLKSLFILAIISGIPAVALAAPEDNAQPPQQVNAAPQPANNSALKPALKVKSLNNMKFQDTNVGKVIIDMLQKDKPNYTFSFVDEMGDWYTLEQKAPIAADRGIPKFLVHPVLGSMTGAEGLSAFYRDIDLFNTDIDPKILAEFSAHALGPASVYSNEYEYNHNAGVKLYVRPPKLKREKDKITFRFNTLCAPPGESRKKLIFHTIEVTPDYKVDHQSMTEPIQLVEIKGHPRKPASTPQSNK